MLRNFKPVWYKPKRIARIKFSPEKSGPLCLLGFQMMTQLLIGFQMMTQLLMIDGGRAI
jgi:hypothetical protein